MNMPSIAWDYLVLTASNAAQASAYEFQLELRRQCGLLPQVREILVVPDLDGLRIGSGGSTLECLVRILEIERRRSGRRDEVAAVLRRLRILIVHAGGDSRRLPAYAPCGKIFVPLPTNSDAPLPVTLFDRLVPDFLALPPGAAGCGQVLVAAGDALVRFDSSQVRFSAPGIVALGCYATPEEAARHGVFCIGEDGAVSVYLQKPSIAGQQRMGAINPAGQTALDVAVMSLDASAAEALLGAFGVAETPGGEFDFSPEALDRMLTHGIDLYREICCALGSAATLDHYVRSARSSGSRWADEALGRLFPALNHVPLHVEIVPSCRFLHFGSTRQLIESGLTLVAEDCGATFFPQASPTVLAVNCRIAPPARINGGDAWLEACRIEADVELAGENVLVGFDVDAPLALPRGACVDGCPDTIAPAKTSGSCAATASATASRTACSSGARCSIGSAPWAWTPRSLARRERCGERALWNARIFPAERSAAGFRRWLWMFAPEAASAQELQAFRTADRYSAADIALLANQEAFHSRRVDIWRSRLPKPCATQ
jgi:fucokinase